MAGEESNCCTSKLFFVYFLKIPTAGGWGVEGVEGEGGGGVSVHHQSVHDCRYLSHYKALHNSLAKGSSINMSF